MRKSEYNYLITRQDMAIERKKLVRTKKEPKCNAGKGDSKKKGASAAIAKRLVGELTDHRKRFCEYYASHPLYRGNGTYCYGLAYGFLQEDGTFPDQKARDVCKSSASQFMAKPEITDAINAILDRMDLNPQAVDAQLAHLIHQHEDKGTKLGAIKEFNRMTNRGQQQGEDAKTVINNLYLAIVQGKRPE